MKWVKLFKSIDEAEKAIGLNKIKLASINGKRIAIMRSADGFYAADDSCPHMHESLSQGQLNAYNELICPLHFYRFNIVTGDESSSRCPSLNTYKIKIEEQGVFIEV